MAQDDNNFSDSLLEGRIYEHFRPQTRIGESGSSEPHISTLQSYIATQYELSISSALEVIKKDVLSGKPIHWDKLLYVLYGTTPFQPKATFRLKFAIEVLNFFERYRCKDASVISDAFKFVFFLCLYDLQLSDLDTYTEMKRKSYIPYGEEEKIDLVWNTASCASVGLLKLQLRFGMEMMAPSFTYSYFLRCIDTPLKFWPHNPEVVDLDVIHQELNDGNLYEQLCSLINPESWKRLWLVFRVFEIVNRMLIYPECTEHLTECYQLLFDSIPDAYVTSSEVKIFLEKCLSDACSNFISKVVEDFERVCPGSSGVPQPRSLQHLSRIQVRRSLCQNLNLPHGVSSLQLPRSLQGYVMLHDDGDYSVVRGTAFVTRRYSLEEQDWRVYCYLPGSVMDIHEEDDHLTLFLRNL